MALTYTTNLGLVQYSALGDDKGNWHLTWTQDNARMESRLSAQYAGNPDTLVAGYWKGQLCFDTTNNKVYVCTTIGAVGVARWTEISSLLTSQNETGDIEATFKTTPKTGWIFLQGQTLGSSSSAASLKGTTYQALYEFIWNNITNTYAPVSSGRGASAAADFAANKTITLPDARDRALFGVGSTWADGQVQGAESLTIAKANLPTDTLSVTGSTSIDGDHTHDIPADSDNGTACLRYFGQTPGDNTAVTDSAGAHSHTVTGTTEPMGSGTALAFLPKGLGVNWMIKL